MARVCIVCHHPERPQLEAALQSGKTLREVGNEFGVAKDALCRHRRKHPLLVAAGANATASAAASTLLNPNATGVKANATEAEANATSTAPPHPTMTKC